MTIIPARRSGADLGFSRRGKGGGGGGGGAFFRSIKLIIRALPKQKRRPCFGKISARVFSARAILGLKAPLEKFSK